MVVFPLGKLIYLGVRQLSKPISVQLRASAARHPFVSRYICAPPAQILNRIDIFVRFRLMGITKKGNIDYKPLSNERAVEMGSEIIGEAFLYSVAAGYIVYEYWRSGKKERIKEEVQSHDIANLQAHTVKLEQQMAQLQQTLDSLQTKLHEHLDNHVSTDHTQQSSKPRSWWSW